EIEDHAGVVRSRWARQQESPMLPATEHGDGPMAAAYGRGLADGQAGLDYQVPPARDGRVRFARCYRHGYEHGAPIQARKSASWHRLLAGAVLLRPGCRVAAGGSVAVR